MKRIIAALTGKVEKLKMERKVNRVNRCIETAIDNAQDAIDRIEEEKAKLVESLSNATEVTGIIEKLSDKIGEQIDQTEICKRLEQVRDYINEEVEVEADDKDKEEKK